MKRRAVVSLAVMLLAVLAVLVGASGALASTEWLAEHLDDPTVRVIAMSDFRQPTHKGSYMAGHIPGAIYLNGMTDLSDPESAIPMRILSAEGFEAMMGRLGIAGARRLVLASYWKGFRVKVKARFP